MELGTWPLLERLKSAKHVLLAGAGGGYDIVAAVPLYVLLRARGQRVSLANLSFTSLPEVRARAVASNVLEVTDETLGPSQYFPEHRLARWLASRGTPQAVFAFAKAGVKPLTAPASISAFPEPQHRSSHAPSFVPMSLLSGSNPRSCA